MDTFLALQEGVPVYYRVRVYVGSTHVEAYARDFRVAGAVNVTKEPEHILGTVECKPHVNRATPLENVTDYLCFQQEVANMVMGASFGAWRYVEIIERVD